MKNKLKWLFSIVCSLLCISVLSACKKEETKAVNVTIEKQAELSLNKTSILLEPGATFALEPTLTNVKKDENEPFVWQSYNTDIVTVENGIVTAGEFGSTYVSVNYGLLNAKCKVTVRTAETSSDELQLKLSQTAVQLNAVYDNAKNENLTATVYKNGEIVQTEFTWESDNSEYVTVENGVVTALKNGCTANVTAWATVDGVRLSAVCKVSAQDDVTITLISPKKVFEPKEKYEIPFSVTVNGERVDAELSWRSFDQGIATVSDGILTAVGGGTTVVEATYGNVKACIDIVVRSYVYVSTAEQFLRIGDGDETYTYVLTGNIDFGAYFAQNIWLNEPYLIENFRGVLDGKGYAITGLTRYCDDFERELLGVFNNVAKSAIIKNIYFGVSLQTGKTGSLFAGQMAGYIENCYLDISLNGLTEGGEGYSLFSSAIGNVKNTVVSVKSESQITVFSLYGFLKCENCLVIANGVACGGRVNGQGSDVNPYFENCYLYESETDLLAGNGYKLLGDGKGQADTQKQYQDFASDIWSFDGKITLKNERNTTPIFSPKVIGSGDKTMDVTEKYVIVDESASGIVFDCYIFNSKGKIVHTLETDGNEFTTAVTGKYTVVSTLVDKDGITGYHVANVTVVNAAELVLTTKNFVLNQGQTATIAVAGKTATEFDYYSSNEQLVAVDKNGVVSAKASGTAQVRLVHKTAGLTAVVTVDVVNVQTITEISTAEELLAIDGMTGGYYLLKNDIELTWTEDRVYNYEFKNAAGDVLKTERYARMIERFDGTLDGNGYTITLRYETSEKKYIPCGLFYRLGEQSTVKNLHYVFNGEYARTDMADYTGLFASRCYGKIQDCYLQANVRHLNGSSSKRDQEGFIAVAYKTSGSTAGYYNNIFHLNVTDENGVSADVGYAIRFGSGAPMVNNCVFIRNGETKTFYGTNGNNGSACEMRYSYFYRTIYDFVYAKNGSTMNTGRQISDIPDNSPVYSLWDARWNISEKGVYLLGRKVADAQYESYDEAPVMEVVHTQRLISWEESGIFDITLNGEYVGSSSNGIFDIYAAIAERYDNPVGSYDIVVEDAETGITGIAIVKIIGVTQENFVEIVRQTEAENAHYILVEDITLTKADFGQKMGAEYYVSGELRTPLDGNGHTVKVEGDLSSLRCGAVFYDVYVTVENLVFRYNVTRLVINDHSGCFANKIVRGGLINSYLDAVVTPVDSNGNVVKAEVSMVHFGVAPMTFRNNIVSLTVFDKDGNVTEQGAVFYKFANGPVCENNAFVHTATEPHFAVEPANGFAKKALYYTSMEGFVLGNGFVSADVKTFIAELVWGVSTEKAYSAWDNVWTVENGKIYLCEKLVYPEPRLIGATVVGNLLTVTDTYKGNRVYDVFVGGEKAVAFTGATCNIVSLLEKAGKIKAGENAFEITVKTASGTSAESTALLNVYGINGTNFVTTVRTEQENVGAWYYVMIEDVTLNKSAYGQTYGSNRLVSASLYVNIDGNGHSLTIQGDISDNVNGAVFGDVRSTVQNLRFYYNVTRREAEHAACFALFINNGGIMKNCYLEANVKLVDANGNMLTSLTNTKWAMIHHINDTTNMQTKLLNVVSKLAIENEGVDGVALVNLGYNRGMAVGCVVIGETSMRKIANTENGMDFDDCYYYDTITDFVTGTNGKYLDRQITNGNNASNTAKAEWTDTTKKAYTSWGDVWTIDETGVKLCGAIIYTVTE